jgi:hypothetical protein
MKNKIIILLILLIFTIPFWMWFIWRVEGKKELKVAIIDKTVLTREGNEHRSFNWILTYKKYCKPDRDLYSIKDDYYGFFPNQNKKYYIKDFSGFDSTKLLDLVNRTDMTYFTDTYGIYYKEWYGENPRGDHSSVIYGGMSQSDIAFLKLMKSQHKLVISEFNTIASPTHGVIRNEFEELFGVKWTGWAGRYFDILDTIKNKELPVWLVRDYKAQHNKRWPFKNSGIAFVNENERVEVLEYKTDLLDEVPYILTSTENQKRFGLPAKIKYSYWFDVTLTSRRNNVISMYKINSNARGDSILASMNIPNPFAAVIEHYDSDYKFYYFCGDFTDNPIEQWFSRFWSITAFSGLLPSSKNPEERESFFWSYYEPFVSTILNIYYESLSKK